MGLYFRKRLRVFPGFSLNFSKSGVSASVGVKGLGMTFGSKGTYVNAGLPGTGIYARFKIDGQTRSAGNTQQYSRNTMDEAIEVRLDEIKSSKVGSMSDEIGMQIIQDIKEAREQNQLIKKEIFLWRIKGILAFIVQILSYVLIFGFFYKKISELNKDCWGIISELKENLANTKVKLDFNFDECAKEFYDELTKAYTELSRINKIWDITASAKNDGLADRSGAGTILQRKIVSFGFKDLDFIECQYEPFHIKNANGGDIYIYPCYIVIGDKKSFDIISILTPDIKFNDTQFIESESVPGDAEILYKTWKKVNKDGSRDKRFKGNYQIPVTHYTELGFTSETGLNERYMFSNFNVSLSFIKAWKNYLEYMKGEAHSTI